MLHRFRTSFRSRDWGGLARSQWVHALVLIPVAWYAFFHNLGISLFEGSEGLYAHITHEMVERREYVHLTYVGEAYVNKSPFFFWVLALSTALLGENEVALRLPGALFSVGTMALTYGLGAVLFSSTAAFWAALVVATTHVFLWYGRRVLFDSMLVFFITLALLIWVRAYIQRAGDRWYALSFIPMALATMTKGLHGLALPLLVIVGFLICMRDLGPLKTRSFWVGLLLSVAIIWAYALAVEIEWGGHSMLGKASIVSLTAPSGGHPIYWYLGVMWFDFFPWSAVIPAGLVLLFSQSPSAKRGSQIFVLTWFVGLLVMFSLSPLKRETVPDTDASGAGAPGRLLLPAGVVLPSREPDRHAGPLSDARRPCAGLHGGSHIWSRDAPSQVERTPQSIPSLVYSHHDRTRPGSALLRDSNEDAPCPHDACRLLHSFHGWCRSPHPACYWSISFRAKREP